LLYVTSCSDSFCLPDLEEKVAHEIHHEHTIVALSPAGNSQELCVNVTDTDGDKIEFKIGRNKTIVMYINNRIEIPNVTMFSFDCKTGKYSDNLGEGWIFGANERLSFARNISYLFRQCGKLHLLHIENAPEGFCDEFSEIHQINHDFDNDTCINNQNQWQSNHSQKNEDNSPASTELHTNNPYQPNPPTYTQTEPTTTEGWGSIVQAPSTNDGLQPQPGDNRLTSSSMVSQVASENIGEE